MTHKTKFTFLSKQSLLLVILLITIAGAANGQAGNLPKYVSGEIVLYMQPGIPKADALALANTVKPISVTPLLLPDCYKLVLPITKTIDADTSASINQLKQDGRTRWVGNNNYYYSFQSTPTAPKLTPNDPRFNEQWGMRLINMPQAWVLQRGVVGVNVAVIDTGFDNKHEDLQKRYSDGSFNFADNTSDYSPNGLGPVNQHGVHVSGVIVANTDNSLGVVSITWRNTLCVGLKGTARTDANNLFPLAALVNSLQFCIDNKDKYGIAVINMSLGGQGDPKDSTSPFYQATKGCTDKGIIVVVAAGNSNADSKNFVPAGFNFSPLFITVSALGQTGTKSSFSNFGKIDVAAPGGDFDNGDAGQILSTLDGAYGVESGTSQASPHVAGVCTLLMSIPGVKPAQAVDALRSTANRTGLTTIPDNNFGYGITDAYAAIARLSVRVEITSPDGINSQGQSSDPANILPPAVETFKPMLSFHVANVNCDNVTFTLDSNTSQAKTFTIAQLTSNSVPGVTDFALTGTCTGANPDFTVSFRLVYPTTDPFQHTVTITGINPSSGITSTDTRIFTITPHVINAGLSMISIPYYESTADSPTGTLRDARDILSNLPTLYRYLLPGEVSSQGAGAVTGAYATYGPGVQIPNANASFRPPNDVPALAPPITGPNGQIIDTRPIGVGYFINAPSAITVVNYGSAYPHRPFRLPLHEGWNLIGDPYPYSVPFNATEFETSNGVRIPISQAVDQKLLLPHIYRFTGNDYTFKTLPDGNLETWEGHWIFVTPKNPTSLSSGTVGNLIVTPTPITSTGRSVKINNSNTNTTRAAGIGGWIIRLEAHAGNSSDSNNFIGMSSKATDGEDITKVAKPPRPNNLVSLGITRANSVAGIYSQDLRPLGGAKEWHLQVSSDQQNTDVHLSWPDIRTLPRNYRLLLTDNVTNQTIDLRNTGSYQFNNGATSATRSFTLTARPTLNNGGHPVISNVIVNPSRAGSRDTAIFDIGYTVSSDVQVEVSILSYGGKVLSQVGATRAVSSGSNHVTWNGRDSAGRPVPAGTYVLQLKATTTEGDATRVVQPLVMSGR